MPRSTLLVAAGLALAAAAPPASYNTVPRRVEGMVNVHIVPHSHDDVRHSFFARRGALYGLAGCALASRRAQPTNPHSAPRRLGGLRRSINTTTEQTTRSSTRTSTPSSAQRCSRCSRTRTGASSRSSKHSSSGGGATKRLPSRQRCRASSRAGSSSSSTVRSCALSRARARTRMRAPVLSPACLCLQLRQQERANAHICLFPPPFQAGGACTTRRAPALSTCSTTRTSASASSSTRSASCPRLLGRLIRSATAASRAACSPRRCREST